MNNFNKFISGKEYSLKDLFGDDNQIVIPDLQRDYCWGDNACTGKDSKPQELVSGFLKNIIELYNTDKKSPVTLGLVYGYEQPYKHIQICDGQQRLTTLFLLISWLVLKTIRADKDRILLSHWNDRAVSAYIEMATNYIVPYDDFHWGNVLCGYSYSHTIKPATDEQNWNSRLNLDSPVSSLPFIADFCDRNKQCISDKDIKRYDGEINALIDGFWETI